MKEAVTAASTEILEKCKTGRRIIVAIAGPPATGKSTFSEELASDLNTHNNVSSVVVPMDGFHLDNVQLKKMGLMQQKGAPETFDFAGFAILVQRLRSEGGRVYFPTFDRDLDKAVAASSVVEAAHNVVLVEGNYLLLNEEPWRDLKRMFDHTIYINTPMEVLKDRLIQRWLDHDHTTDEARARAMSNDIPNAERVADNPLEADQIL